MQGVWGKLFRDWAHAAPTVIAGSDPQSPIFMQGRQPFTSFLTRGGFRLKAGMTKLGRGVCPWGEGRRFVNCPYFRATARLAASTTASGVRLNRLRRKSSVPTSPKVS